MILPDRVQFLAAPSPRRPLQVDRIEPRVALLKIVAGMDDRMVRWVVDEGMAGLVIEGSGAGNVPDTAVPGIAYALDRGVPVVLTSRCPAGVVSPTYGTPGGGRSLRELGVILGGDLNGPKARLKLMALLGRTRDRDQLRRDFEDDGAVA